MGLNLTDCSQEVFVVLFDTCILSIFVCSGTCDANCTRVSLNNFHGCLTIREINENRLSQLTSSKQWWQVFLCLHDMTYCCLSVEYLTRQSPSSLHLAHAIALSMFPKYQSSNSIMSVAVSAVCSQSAVSSQYIVKHVVQLSQVILLTCYFTY